MVEDYRRCLKCLNTRGKRQRWKGGEEKRGGRNEKNRSPDVYNAVADDKGYSDSSSSLCLGLYVGHIVRERAVSVSHQERWVVFTAL